MAGNTDKDSTVDLYVQTADGGETKLKPGYDNESNTWITAAGLASAPVNVAVAYDAGYSADALSANDVNEMLEKVSFAKEDIKTEVKAELLDEKEGVFVSGDNLFVRKCGFMYTDTLPDEDECNIVSLENGGYLYSNAVTHDGGYAVYLVLDRAFAEEVPNLAFNIENAGEIQGNGNYLVLYDYIKQINNTPTMQSIELFDEMDDLKEDMLDDLFAETTENFLNYIDDELNRAKIGAWICLRNRIKRLEEYGVESTITAAETAKRMLNKAVSGDKKMKEAIKNYEKLVERMGEAGENIGQLCEKTGGAMSTLSGRLADLGNFLKIGVMPVGDLMNIASIDKQMRNTEKSHKLASTCDGSPDAGDPNQYPGVSKRPVYDPSGYVYEAVPSNRVEGVKAECYYLGDVTDEYGMPTGEKQDVLWNAEEYDQVNPLFTDENGMYAWDVPLGEWLVKFSKEGYKDTDSKKDAAANENGYLPVPPPQTAVNTAIVSESAPTVKNINVYNDGVQIIFSQYMNIDSVNTTNVKVSCEGREISGTMLASNAEYNYENTVQYASIFNFVPDEDISKDATISINNVMNYAGMKINSAFVETKTVKVRPKSLSVSESTEVKYNSGTLVEVCVIPAEAGKNKRITAVSSSPDISGVVNSTVITDENGKANIMLEGKLPGECVITVSLDGTDISQTSKVTVGNVENHENICEKVTASIESGTVVEKNTKVTLSTKTPDAEIYYTLDGTCPCEADNPARIKYTGPIEINEYTFIIAYAVKDGLKDSLTAGFVYKTNEVTEKAAMPTANPSGGAVASGTSVTLSTATPGAQIYYTTDTSEPTVNSTLYTAPVSISDAVTFKAIAVKEGMLNSDVMTASYTITTTTSGGGGGGGRGGSNKKDSAKEPENVENRTFIFKDVKETDWYYEAVKFAYEKGITSGVSENSFAPSDSVTRGQFITMLCRAYGINEMTGDNFADCGNTWYTGYLAAAKQLGISSGVGNNKFAPEKKITREEMVTLIYNYLKAKGEIREEYKKADFADSEAISDWAQAAVSFASGKGYVKGKENSVFDPKGNATRAELAQIFFNIFK